MKKCIKLAFLFLIFGPPFSYGQIPIKLEINHKLGTDRFHMHQMTQNNLQQNFEVTGLRYYLSGFSIIHDSGQVIEIPDLLFFVDVSLDSTGPNLVELGEFNVNKIEAISFYMGVDSARNHSDPASYSMGHPLAPKSPSMHWGWANGYFFLSLTGKSGTTLDKVIDLQCLDDDNYYQAIVQNPLVTDYTDELLISLDADYEGLLKDMDISEGVSLHGPFLWAKDALVNASQFVFKPSTSPFYTSLSEDASPNSFLWSPNPVMAGQEIFLKTDGVNQNMEVIVNTLDGKKMSSEKSIFLSQEASIQLFHKGIYVIQLVVDGKILSSSRVVVY